MKNEQIEQAAKEWSGFPEKDAYPYYDAFITGATFVNEKQPYSREDMKIRMRKAFEEGVRQEQKSWDEPFFIPDFDSWFNEHEGENDNGQKG